MSARCAGCSADLGRLSDPDQLDLIRRHFETCTKHLEGEGIIKTQQVAWAFVEGDGA